jgi:uncharacterized pyridoxal phosphate-dependent enzyme
MTKQRGSGGEGILDRLGVRPVINAAGAYTRVGGALMAPEALAAFNEVARCWVSLEELQARAGAYLAERLAVEAAYVSSGASGGIFVAVAGILAGTDPQRILRLPEVDGPNEVVAMRAHRGAGTYNQCAKAAGARVREIGTTDGATAEELAGAISDRTAAILYYQMYEVAGRLELSTVIEVARAHRVSRARVIPIIVDAAAELPPRENFTRYLRMGADLVLFSGGKELRGPQGAGLVLGRKDLIAACAANGCPQDAIGRPLKVTKEEIAALVAAVDRYLALDLDAQWRAWEDQVAYVVAELKALPGVSAERFVLGPTSECRPLVPNAMIRWDPRRLGKSVEQVDQVLRAGNPRIWLRPARDGLAFNPHVLQPGQEKIVVQRLKEVLGG